METLVTRCVSCRLTLPALDGPCPGCSLPAPTHTARDRVARIRAGGAPLRDRPLPGARLLTILADGQWVRLRRVLGSVAEVQIAPGHVGYVDVARLEVAPPVARDASVTAAWQERAQRFARACLTWAGGALATVPRGLGWLQRSPRRAYTAAAAMTMLAALLLAIDHYRDAGGQAATPPARAEGGAGIAATIAILSPADGVEVTAPVRVAVQPSTRSDQAGLRLAYFVDLDPATVLAAGLPVPFNLPGVTLTAAPSLTLDLAPGPHTLWVAPIDRDGLPLPGVVPARVHFTVTAVLPPGMAPLVYQTFINGQWRLATPGERGTVYLLPGGAWDDVDPAWSSDGTRLAFASNREGALRVYVAGAAGEQPLRVTDGPGQDRQPAWSPDGRWLLFVSDRDGGREQVYMVPAEGGAVRQLTHGPGGGSQPSWAPDGLHFAFVRLVDGQPRIFIGDTLGGAPRPLAAAPGRQVQPAWSPDGRFIAFAGLEDGRWSIYLAAADGGNVRRVTSGGAAHHPTWSPDGRRLAFVSERDGRSQIVVLDLDSGTVRPLTDPAVVLNPAWPRR